MIALTLVAAVVAAIGLGALVICHLAGPDADPAAEAERQKTLAVGRLLIVVALIALAVAWVVR